MEPEELRLQRIRNHIMEELYKEAKPVGITLREAQELEKQLENEAYSLTYISKEKQDAIIRSHTKILNNHHTQQVKRSVLMGAAPSNNLEQVQEQREKAGLPPINQETQEQQEDSEEEQELLEEIVEELENRNSAYYMDELTPKEIVEEVLNSAAQVIDLSEEDIPEEIKEGEQQSE
jgi:hypothetical protein